MRPLFCIFLAFFLFSTGSNFAFELSIEGGEVQTEEENQLTSDEIQKDFRRSLMQVVLRGQIFEKNPNQENDQAYQSIVDLVIARVLPEASMEEPVELVEFYRVMSGFEVSKMKYFLPLLKDFRRQIQSQLALDGHEHVESEMLAANIELIKSIEASIVDRLESSQETQEEGESTEEIRNDDSVETDPQPSNTGTIKKMIDRNVRAIVAMQEELSQLREMVKTVSKESLSNSEGGQARGELAALLNSMEKKQDKTLELLMQLSRDDAKEPSEAEEMGVGGEESAPRAKGRYASDEEEERYAEDSVIRDPSNQDPPHAFEYKVYGIDAAALRRLVRSGSLTAEGSEDFDPRVYRVLERNNRQWALLLNDWAYKGVPTTLAAHLGEEGIQIHLGDDKQALKIAEKAYAEAVREYLESGGSECTLRAARKASTQPFIAPTECK